MNPSTIFFSYSRKDAQEFAFKLANDLRAAGANVWIDQLDIPPGKNWDEEIEKALKASKYILFVASEMSVSSQNVLNEIYYAVDENKSVIPVRIHDCTIPFRIRRFQYIDFTKDYNTALSQLKKYLELQVKNEPVATEGTTKQAVTPAAAETKSPASRPSVTVSEPKPSAGKSNVKKRILFAIAAILLAAAVVFGVNKMKGDEDDVSSDSSYADSTATGDTFASTSDSGVYSPGFDSTIPDESTPAVAQTQQNEASQSQADHSDGAQENTADHEPSYPGGRTALTRYLEAHMQYPEEAIQERIEGVVSLHVTIEADGSIGDVTAVAGPKGGGLRRETIRLIKSSGEWKPAVRNGEAVRSIRRIGVPFKLKE